MGFKEKFAYYTEDPMRIMVKARSVRLRALRAAFGSRMPDLDVEEVVFNDQVEPDRSPKDQKEMARRLYNNRLGLSLATAIETKTKFRLFMFALISSIVLTALTIYAIQNGQTFMERLALYVGGAVLIVAGGWLSWLSLGFSPVGYALILPKKLLDKSDKEDARDFANRVLIRETYGATPDLADRFRPLTIDAEGRPVDGQVIAQDLTECYAWEFTSEFLSVLTPIAISVLFVGIGFIATAYVESAQNQMFTAIGINALPKLFAGLALLVAAFQLFAVPGIAERRAVAAQEAREASPLAKLVAEAGESNFVQVENARKKQLANTQNDKSHFVLVGESTGLFAERRDSFAPSEAGMPVGLSVNDLSTHLLVLGDTGTGKTSGVLRPVIKAWTDANSGGLVVLDGKGVLPAEVAGLQDFRVISPTHDAFNPIENLTPDEVADGIAAMFASPNAADPYFDLAATKLIRAAANVLKLAAAVSPSIHFNLSHLYALAMTEAGMDAARAALFDGAKESLEKMPRVAQTAWQYLSIEFPALPERTRGSILGNVSVWLSTFVDNEKLAAWADATTGVQIEDALGGARIGVLLPEAEYGRAGAAVANLCKQRLYRALKLRGDSWKPGRDKRVLLLVDECQSLLTKDDTAMLPIARSLGLHALFSTQNVDGMIAALGGSPKIHEAEQLLGQFKSVISLSVSTKATKEFVADRMGSCPRARYTNVNASALDAAGTAQALKRQAGGYSPDTAVGQATLHSGAVAQMRKISGLGGQFTAMKAWAGEQLGLNHLFDATKSAPATLSVGISKLVEPDEVSVLTAEPDTALVSVMRGRVPRRDLVRLKPIYKF